MEQFLRTAKESQTVLNGIKGEAKNNVLRAMSEGLRTHMGVIIEANKKDMEYATQAKLSSALLDRLLLDEKRIEAMAQSIEEIAMMNEPVGRVLDGWINKDGLKIEKVSVPIGVIGIIYESRPNVTSDTAALCFKSGNVCILKGGKEAAHSNEAIASVLQGVLEAHGLPKEIISLIPDASREGVAKLIKFDKYIDLIIPRGGETLIRFVLDNATVPVVKHDKGLCHVYLHKDADMNKALPIIINAKVQRPGVCNAMETLLIDESIASNNLLNIQNEFLKHGTKLKGCQKTQRIIDIEAASEEDFDTEYLENILSIKVVSDLDEAIRHINTHGSQHSDSIVTESYEASERFLNEIDSACVYVNASTRFTDGGVFGFGAEVGISTNKLHARGPMGINDLTTYKFMIRGSGQTRK